MRTKNGAKRMMTIKVDLKKVYNHLDWNILENALRDIRLSDKFVSIIMACNVFYASP